MKSKMLQRVLANKNQFFQHKDGTFKLLGMYGRIVPIFTLVFIEKLFEDNFDKKKVDDLLYLAGESQSYSATAWTVNKIGIPVKGNELKIFRENSGHGEITGAGKTKIIKFDMKNKIIIAKIDNNIFCKQYQKCFGIQKECVDHYVRGLFSGTAKFLFGEDVIVIPKECASMGKKWCIYKIVPQKEYIEKYGEKVKEYVPDKSLNIDAIKQVNIKNFLK